MAGAHLINRYDIAAPMNSRCISSPSAASSWLPFAQHIEHQVSPSARLQSQLGVRPAQSFPVQRVRQLHALLRPWPWRWSRRLEQLAWRAHVLVFVEQLHVGSHALLAPLRWLHVGRRVSALDFEILGRGLAPVCSFFVFDRLAFIKSRKSRSFDR